MPEDHSEQAAWKANVHAQLIAHLHDTEERRFQLATQLNKTVIALSSGTLALSMTLLNKIIFNNPSHIQYLYAAWVSFMLTILLSIAGNHISIKALVKHSEICTRYYSSILETDSDSDINAPINPENNPYTTWLTVIDSVVNITFIIAFIFLGIFIMKNIK